MAGLWPLKPPIMVRIHGRQLARDRDRDETQISLLQVGLGRPWCSQHKAIERLDENHWMDSCLHNWSQPAVWIYRLPRGLRHDLISIQIV